MLDEKVEDSWSDADENVAKFRVDDRVFCKDSDDLYYEAVVRKLSFRGNNNNKNKNNSKGWTYLIHFLGWNTRWDKWVTQDLLRPPSEELRLLAMEQEKKVKEEKQQKAQASQEKKRKKRDMEDDGRTKRRNDAGTSDHGGERMTWEDYCELPFTLKTVLIDEKDRIMRVSFNGPMAGVDHDFEPGHYRTPRDVHDLPASVNIKTVLNQYVKVKKKTAESPDAAAAAEQKARVFADGLSKLFEEALPVCLLYHPERAQYMSIKADPVLKSLRLIEIYGCEFLLRLFVRLPALLEQAWWTRKGNNRKAMGEQLQELIVLLQKNRQACFKAKYREPKISELNDFEKALMSSDLLKTDTTPMDS